MQALNALFLDLAKVATVKTPNEIALEAQIQRLKQQINDMSEPNNAGYLLVPVEPNSRMLTAGMETLNIFPVGKFVSGGDIDQKMGEMSKAWKGMLSFVGVGK